VTIIFFKSIGGLPNLGLNSRHVSNWKKKISTIELSGIKVETIVFEPKK
jgi:hypothetical protein